MIRTDTILMTLIGFRIDGIIPKGLAECAMQTELRVLVDCGLYYQLYLLDYTWQLKRN